MHTLRVVVLACLAMLPATVRAQDTFDNVERIVAVGDVHGDYEQFVLVLREAGVIDSKARWTGGRTFLVQTGDVLDRGPASRKVMDLLMALSGPARKAGGRVIPLIGNHEAMNILGDLRYVSAGEYASYKSGNWSALQERAWQVLSDSARRGDSAYRKMWFDEHPPGWVEQRFAFEGNGKYGTWIRTHDAVIRINDMLFLHGGLSSKYSGMSLDELNTAVRAALAGDKAPPPDNIAEDSLGPLWYRGLATGDEAMLAPLVDTLLQRFGVKHIVIGHTVTPGTVMPRFGGKVIMIDVGLSAVYGGTPAFLVVERGAAFVMHRGTRLDLPLVGDLFPYLKAAAALDPPGSRLQQYVEQLAAVRGAR
ncbi:MAG: metallophosphoesterase [Gemmatimonadaceae bacterium]|nr:metallophosphoesterase [Gemmatimonadaceae bacterium]